MASGRKTAEHNARIVRNFAKNLRPHCDGKQEEIAKRARLSRPYLNYILNQHCVPSLPVAYELSKAVGVPLSELLGD